jgi:LmbE family N-acetylglucosaminyl deacetylase
MRMREAAQAAAVINGTYHCLDVDDIYIFYNKETINKATALIRKVNPEIVLTHNPTDYMADHEITCQIVKTACFCTGMRNMEVKETPGKSVPHLYYCDVLEGNDYYGNRIPRSIYVNVSEVIETKEKMLKCHASQRNWLMSYHKMDEYILSMKRYTLARGKEINVEYAEAFRQHLGHGFPKSEPLKEALGDLVTCKPMQND